ncbi:MAG: tetratricopeptide repeat protein [Bdellovibrionales bacterium]|nr:tetratricopeptide repeat protein [Bdellovibrionales bacterium]
MRPAYTRRVFSSLAPLLCLFAYGCSSGQIQVESDPAGADVNVVSGGGMKQKIGQTPLTLTPAQFPNAFGADVQIQVSKDGYRAESFLLPPQASGAVGRIQAKLADDPVSKTCQDTANSIADATDAVAQIQRLIYKKNYGDAERALVSATVKYPAVPIFYSLLGNVYYLEKQLDKALESYRHAAALQPQNLEIARMIEKIRGIRMPSGGGT